MLEKTFAPVAILAAAVLTCGLAQAQQAATLTIHADQPVTNVSPTLYGLMTEEINYSYDGGLYAEMVRNRTFHSDWSGVPYWYLYENGDAAAKMDLDKTTGPSEALPASLRLNVEKADPKNQAGALNVGYWGFALRPETTYKGSFYAKAGSTDLGPVTISLISDDTGKTVADATVSSIGSDWKQYEFTIKTGAIQPSSSNHLVLSIGHPGTLWLDLVSLFPPTYLNRDHGNRIDLMEKLAAMRPTFLRFPGGNYLEGDTIADRFDWKKTIGPLVDRPTHPSPWFYHSDDGMGLLEFLEWCEDLKMNPVLAVYAGYSLRGEHVPADQLQPYIQDALDEIEYVTGGPDTKWGAQRIKDGHPAPFKLTYVEIGNEDWLDKSGSYEERYPPFYNAIKAKYPTLQLIATAPVKSARMDVLDEHFYVHATQNFHDATHYDKTDRNGPKIFVGEWATREGFPTPDFGAALGDAAWMTGLERNSDIIVMASYAPLLVRVDPGGMQWETNLIGYNAMQSYGSPAYFAQVLFASYLGDHTLGSKLEGAGPKLFYSITANAAKKQLYLKLVNASSDAQPIDINLEGASLANTAKLVSLHAHDMRETNSITDPERIIPVDSTLHNVGNHFHHTVPGYSIQVIQIDKQ
ncbi:MAG: alpha-L-arabinofuranosidase C-terminal domain-containing protein [Terracidiphilus sp.]